MSQTQQEQLLIQQFHNYLQTNDSTNIQSCINRIQTEFRHSYILQYYLGIYYENMQQFDLAESAYQASIQIKQLFTPPYFQLSSILINNNKLKEAENLLIIIFNKKTLDPMSPIGEKVYNLMDDLRILTILIPEYVQRKEYKKMENMFKILIPRIKQIKRLEYRHIEVWKNIHICYANIQISKYFDMEAAHNYYYEGLQGLCDYQYTQKIDTQNNLHKLDLSLFHGYSISCNYVLSPKKLHFTINDLYSRYRKPINTLTRPTNKKIKIGYLSPDLNKNAVGLFVTSLLKYFDKDKFEIYVYYTLDKCDEFTRMFQSYIDNWYDVTHMDDDDLYNLIKNNHNIDILFDLIVLGVSERLKMIAKKPAPIIINYLGYPDISGLKEIDYRLIDNITDPKDSYSNSEELVKMPNCFICYTLFEIVPQVSIKYNNYNDYDKNVYIGIMNKFTKHHLLIRKIWLEILQRRKNYILCIKLGQGENKLPEGFYDDFPKDQIKLLPFTETLPEYLEQFNLFDFCMDTYPYSGTTTTCSSLLMGVPVFTIYKGEHGEHVGNVSGSLIYNTGKYLENEDYFVCKSLKEYKDRIIKYTFDKSIELDKKKLRREAFMKAMDPVKFMKDFESVMTELYYRH